MRKSAQVTVTVVAAMGLAARGQQRPDPCDAASFNEEVCRQAVQARGYCLNGKWVRLKYQNPYPFYYDLYAAYAASGGAVAPMTAGTCSQPRASHGGSHGGFGATGAGRGGGS
jgi:hypothetical protein